MFEDFSKALGQLGEPGFFGVLLKSIALTLGLLVGLFGLTVTGLSWLLPETLSVPGIGPVAISMGLVSFAAFVSFVVLSAVLMLPVATLFVGFFLDDVAASVEAKHYAHLPPISPLPLSDTILDGLRFFGVLVLANLLALVVYLLSNVFAPLVFWAVNGFLLGREYFQLVAARRLGHAKARALRKAHGGRIWVAGILMAIPLSIPFINLLIPLLGVATFTHQFHRLSGEKAD
ncbi:MAG: EI24 domain-containing protein [Pseudomonadota bacterium]